ncbi:hypothetical protein IPG36_02060 [bacterium]|nr:MAG: hypothetical protein IPG36_02060 [bacterium]
MSILATLFRGLSTIGITDFATAATFMNALVLWLSLVMLYLVARRLYGAAVARLTWPLGLLLLVLSPQISTVYTDTLAMIFPISLWYVALKIAAAEQGRRRFAADAGGSAIGYWYFDQTDGDYGDTSGTDCFWGLGYVEPSTVCAMASSSAHHDRRHYRPGIGESLHLCVVYQKRRYAGDIALSGSSK